MIALNLIVLEKAKYIDPFSSEFTMSSEGLVGLMSHICFMINSRGVTPLVLLDFSQGFVTVNYGSFPYFQKDLGIGGMSLQ